MFKNYPKELTITTSIPPDREAGLPAYSIKVHVRSNDKGIRTVDSVYIYLPKNDTEDIISKTLLPDTTIVDFNNKSGSIVGIELFEDIEDDSLTAKYFYEVLGDDSYKQAINLGIICKVAVEWIIDKVRKM